jgi:hypothetical protein
VLFVKPTCIGPLMFKVMLLPVLRFVKVTKTGPEAIVELANKISRPPFGFPAAGA